MPTRPHARRVPVLPWTDLDIQTTHGRVAVRMGQGQGVPLLFLHGNSADKSIFAGQMSGALAPSCKMIALDLPGHGASQDADAPERTYAIGGYADVVIEVLEALDLPQVAIVGWSLGGHVALDVAERYPGVLGVMLCGTPPVGTSLDAIVAGFVPSPALALAGQSVMTPGETDAFARLTVGDTTRFDAGAAIARTDGRARACMFANLLAGRVADQRAFVETTTVPIAIVNGDDDPLVNVDYLKSLHYSSLWYRRVHLVHGGGHAPFHTRPDRFDAVLSRFIRSMDRRMKSAAANPDLCLSG